MINKSKNKIELYPLGRDKNLIYEALSNNQDVVDLLLGEKNTTESFKSRFSDTLFVDTTQLVAKTYITMDTEVVSAENTKIKCIAITIDIFTDLSLISLTGNEQIKYYKIGYYGNRIDCLLDAVKRTIADLDIGIGEITLAPRNPIRVIQPTNKHYGKRMILYTYDF